MTSLATLIFFTILQVPSLVPPPDALAQAQAVLAAIVAKEFASVEEQFTGEMKAALPSGRLAAIWTRLLSQSGAHKSCETNPRVMEDRGQADGDHGLRVRAGNGSTSSSRSTAPAGSRDWCSVRPLARRCRTRYPPTRTRRPTPRRPTTVGSGEWALPATLTMPAATRSVPAVVLVHGSGPNDRDETVGANKPFKDLAAGLASRGVAVLRYDKRTRVHGAKMAAAHGLHRPAGSDRGCAAKR